MIKLQGIIYLVQRENTPVYVGQELQTEKRFLKNLNKFNSASKLLKERMRGHKSASKRGGKGGCRAFNSATRKYGFDSFTFTIIHGFDALGEEALRRKANTLEIEEIRNHNTLSPNGYNLTSGGQSEFKVSEETSVLLSEAGKARRGKYTESAKLNMSAALMGHSVSPETRTLISQRVKETFTPERRLQISERNSAFTDEQETEIAEKYQTGMISTSQLAIEYEVTSTTISSCLKRKGIDVIHGQGGSYAKGANHPRAKITEEIARAIYARKTSVVGSGRETAKEFNVTPQLVSRIWTKQKWIHIHDTS